MGEYSVGILKQSMANLFLGSLKVLKIPSSIARSR
jgi:hypothetical protein